MAEERGAAQPAVPSFSHHCATVRSAVCATVPRREGSDTTPSELVIRHDSHPGGEVDELPRLVVDGDAVGERTDEQLAQRESDHAERK